MSVNLPWVFLTRTEKAFVIVSLFLKLCFAALIPTALIALIVWLVR